MAAYRAYAHAQARRDLPVLITGGAKGDYIPAHSGQFADGLPQEPEICSRLDLLIESLPAGSVLVGIETVSQERIGHPHQLVMSRAEQRLGVAVRCLRHGLVPGSSVRATRPYGAGIPPPPGWADPGQPGAA